MATGKECRTASSRMLQYRVCELLSFVNKLTRCTGYQGSLIVGRDGPPACKRGLEGTGDGDIVT